MSPVMYTVKRLGWAGELPVIAITLVAWLIGWSTVTPPAPTPGALVERLTRRVASTSPDGPPSVGTRNWKRTAAALVDRRPRPSGPPLDHEIGWTVVCPNVAKFTGAAYAG